MWRKRIEHLCWQVRIGLVGLCVFLTAASEAYGQTRADTTLSQLPSSLTEFNSPVETQAPKRPIRVTYISPFITVFWADVRRFMNEVASDLDIELSYIDASSRFQALQAAERISELDPKPDYLIFSYQHGISQQIFKAANERGIKSFVINTDTPENEAKEVGLPREKMPLWIGQLYSDNVDVGYRLADKLIDIARQKKPKKNLKMIAIGGELYVPVAEKRKQGLMRRINEGGNVTLKRAIYTRWLEENAYQGTYELLQLYPDTDIIWAASDLLAHGSMGAMQKLGYMPGKDIIVGGVDWSLGGVKDIVGGTMNVSMGGHFMEGGWALIMINDYHHGIDFKEDIGVKINLPMTPIAEDSAKQFSQLFDDDEWRYIDFKAFSKFYTPARQRYDFSLDAVFAAYKAQQSSQELPSEPFTSIK
ncbi:hypothetical protein TDB9533_01294 [Thalassocella blandensis]|nr:hypothetical protein TDB9533_01294 [Thalassocella blandensis]